MADGYKPNLRQRVRGSIPGAKYGNTYYSSPKGGKIVSNTVRSVQNTGYAITGGWNQMSYTMKGLISLVLTLAVLFVPFGIFQYAGWYLYLAFAWIINSFYWLLASIVNLISDTLISSLATITRYLVELVGGTYSPLPSWQLPSDAVLDVNSFKPTVFDTRYLAEWLWDVIKPVLGFVRDSF